MPGPRLPPGPPVQTSPAALAGTVPAHSLEGTLKPRGKVYLCILDSLNFEHNPGELYSSVSAGFGRFDCDKLLKPSGVELMNLPKTANIEVSVHRRLIPGAEPPAKQQPLYRGYISLAQVKAMGVPVSLPGDGNTGANFEVASVFEEWLGLLNGDTPLPSSSHDHLFVHCLELGKTNGRRPKLHIRLQYLPAGVPLAALPRLERPSTQVRVAPPMSVPAPQAFPSIIGQGAPPPSEVEVLRSRLRALEKENDELRAERSVREVAEKDITNQVSQLVHHLGVVPAAGGKGDQLPIAQASATLQEVSAKVADLTSQGAAVGSFYRPVISDAVDCLVAATLLRLGFECTDQLVRLGPGHYQFGEVGQRLYCRIDKGLLLTQPEEPDQEHPDEQLPAPVEFGKLISELISGQPSE